MKKYIAVIICSLAVVLWTGFIWSNSAKTGEESQKASSQVQEIVEEVADTLNVSPPSEKTVRKSAHFIEYAVLGLLVAADMVLLRFALPKSSVSFDLLRASAALPFSFTVALIDEFAVQRASEGRGPSFKDVLIDLSGSLCGLLFVLAAFLITLYIVEKRRAKREARQSL